MKCVKIRCIHYKEQADRWIIITDTGNSFPYSKNFKDKAVEAWLARGHMVAHRNGNNGMFEDWMFID